MFDYYKTVILVASLMNSTVGVSGSQLSCLFRLRTSLNCILFIARWQI